MADDAAKKRVDESWKEQAEREKRAAPAEGPTPGGAEAAAGTEPDELPEARLDLFISGLAMEALVATGDVPHPVTRKPAADLKRAKYLIDLLGVFEAKTKGNLTVEEEKMHKDVLYQLRMRYLSKSGAA